MDMKFFQTKRTYRKFKQEPISDGDIMDILEAARLASCGGNRQNLKYVVVKKPDNVKKLNELVKWAAYLPIEIGTPKEDEIPVLFIAVCHDKELGAGSDIDAGLAIGNMTTLAWTKGIGSCIMGAIDRAKIAEMLGLSDDFDIKTLIAFGYPKKESRVVDCDGDIRYYLDENGDTCVPKRSVQDTTIFFD